VIFAIDHIVFAATPEQSREMREALVGLGFSSEAFSLAFPEIGATSESVSFVGGGFVEFVARIDEARAPGIWFNEIPRIIGVGFSSDDFDADTHWAIESHGWVMNEDHALPDGSCLNIHAAGPHSHFSDFYVFVMDRPEGLLQFPERKQGGPRLRRLTFAGEAADSWRERLREWLGLAENANVLYVGDVELTFRRRSRPGICVTPLFEDARQRRHIPLSEGAIELLA